jgi:hypothetical protein
MDVVKDGRFRVPEEVLISEVGGESVLLNLRSERYFGLDEIGTDMWAALTASGSVSGACETLLAKYDVDASRLRQDLEALVKNLTEHGLLEVV